MIRTLQRPQQSRTNQLAEINKPTETDFMPTTEIKCSLPYRNLNAFIHELVL